jgi:hypothetical protein
LHAHLLAYPATLLLPAGRAAGEALKAVVLVRHVGVERAAAAALLNQSLALLAVFVVSLPCVLVAFTTLGPGVLSWAIATQTATAIGLGALIGVAARRRQIGGALTALSRKLGAATERVVVEVRRIGALPVLPFAAHVANRALLVLQIALLAGALSVARGADALLVVGSYFVGTAAGDIVPAQLGATDGALALAAPTLGASVAQLVSLALLIHVTQLCWALAGVGASLFGAARQR